MYPRSMAPPGMRLPCLRVSFTMCPMSRALRLLDPEF